MDKKIKMLYITGFGRNGSTIIGNVLGSIPGFTHVGEVCYIWDRGFIENWQCGCSKPFSECPTWNKVLFKAFPNCKQVDARRFVKLREEGLRSKDLLLLEESKYHSKVMDEKMSMYLESLEKLYQAIQTVFKSRVIIDSSKFPSYGYILGNLPSVDLYVLHLVRDPRAASYSWWNRRKSMGTTVQGPKMPVQNPLKISILWNGWNYIIRKVWKHKPDRYILLRYEDFVADPRSTVLNILQKIGEKDVNLPFVGEREVVIGLEHTISGNPVRFKSGTIEIKPDDVWKDKISLFQHLVVTLITWPWLRQYKYGKADGVFLGRSRELRTNTY